MTAALIVASFGLPLVVAAACAFAALRRLALIVAPWVPLPALYVALSGDPTILVSSADALLGTRWGLGRPGAPLLAFTAVVWLAALQYAAGYLAHDARRVRFTAFMLLTYAGNAGVLLARDAGSFYLFFALMTFAAYPLVIHAGDAPAHRAGRIYIVLAVIGEALLLGGMMLACAAADSIAIDALPAAVAASPSRALITLLLVTGFGVKAGMLGLHVWLPLAHPVAPTPASAVLSGTMIKTGLLGWLVFLPLGHAAMPEVALVMACAGLGGAFYGVVVGLAQDDPKVILAYSSVSQMGLMLLAVAAGLAVESAAAPARDAALVLAIHHGLAKAALFLGVGVAAGVALDASRMRVLLLLALPALVLVGAPWTSGAAGKLLLGDALGGAPWGAPFKAVLGIAATGTGLLMLRLLYVLQRAPRSAHAVLPRERTAWLALVALSVTAAAWIGQPRMTGIAMPPTEVTAALWPLGAALAAALLAGRMPRSWRAWRVAPGDMLQAVPASSLHLTLVSIEARIGAIVQDGWTMLVRRFRRLRRRLMVAIGREEHAFPRWAGTAFLFVVVAMAMIDRAFS